ncbi:cryptochrome-1-like [Mya arenaria]|uniref:cryptochrome-1-like n=1 Tax=Mya arenaria TaxID=6604 RepID=UPI0022E07077|nr:cryptochrome-1-like [Mya arenaria]
MDSTDIPSTIPVNENIVSDKPVCIHWFRHGLRLHDNPALLDAVEDCGELYPIFIFDGEVAGTRTAGYNRMRFLLESLHDLDDHFSNEGGRLFVFTGNVLTTLSNLFKEWSVSKLTFDADVEAIWHERDTQVRRLCEEYNVECVEKVSHVLWDPEEILKNNGGTPPLTYSLFNLVATAVGDPPRPVDAPDLSKVTFNVKSDHEKLFGIPDSASLGVFAESEEQNQRFNIWTGGESKALELFRYRMKVEEMAFSCGNVMPNQAFPNIAGPPLSMSAHLRFGCLSIRKLYWGLRDAYLKLNPGKAFTVSAIGQLMWREYFYMMSVNNKNYDKMENNPICLNIPWYEDKEKLRRWEQGETGYPWIDAIMKQLKNEGWIHHVCRHATSTFLTRGDLGLSWEDGLKVFDKYLIDADWSVNAGNWMWMSSSAFEKVLQCPKCFCPVRYGRKMDSDGVYVRRYLPVLKDMPIRYLFEPWKAPRSVQEKAGCIIGVDYPEPMVDHRKASKDCYNMMSEVKMKLAASGKELEHCGPANSDEVSKFVWLPGTHKGNCSSGNEELSEAILCDGLMGMSPQMKRGPGRCGGDDSN